MRQETAAKLLEKESSDTESILYGDFWIEDEHYEVEVESKEYLEGLNVRIKEGEEWTEQTYLDEFEGRVETHVRIDEIDRALIISSQEPRIPETDDELEAYTRRAIDNYISGGLGDLI